METTKNQSTCTELPLDATVYPQYHQILLEAKQCAHIKFDHEVWQTVAPNAATNPYDLPIREMIPELVTPLLMLKTRADYSTTVKTFYLWQEPGEDERSYYYSLNPDGSDPQLIGTLADHGPGSYIKLELKQEGDGDGATIVIGTVIIDP